MAQHQVRFTVPERPVGNSDIEFSITRDGAKFGKLRVSKGAIVWIPVNKTYGHKLGWAKFAELAVENGTDGHK